MWKCVGTQEMVRGLGVGGADGNKGRGVGTDRLTDVFSAFLGRLDLLW